MKVKSMFAEAIATFALILIGGGAVVMNDFSGGALGLVGIAIAHGLVLMAMIYAIGHISGGHVNPAVTIAMFVTKNIDFMNAIGYIVAQLIGAAVAGFLLIALFRDTNANLVLSVPDLAPTISMGTGILMEIVLTFFLVFVVFGTVVDKRAPTGMYGLAIGLVLTFDILFGGPFTGGAMNPARVFGPAIATGHWANHMVYWIGPIVGGLIAGLFYQFVLYERD